MPSASAASRTRSLADSRAMSASRFAFWRSSVPIVVTAREMPVLSLSMDTCMATMPPSSRPTSQIHTRPRRRPSTTRCSGSARIRSKTPVGAAAAADARGCAGGSGPQRAGDAPDVAGRRTLRRPRTGGVAGAGGLGRHYGSSLSLRAARRRADFERGLSAISPAVGTTERRKTGSASGARPRAHGQVGRADAPARLAGEEALDAPVLERMERDRGQAAADAQHVQASGSAASSCASSSLTAMRIAWKVRLAGCPPANRAGAGMAAVIASTSSKVVVSGLRARRRSIWAAIRSA